MMGKRGDSGLAQYAGSVCPPLHSGARPRPTASVRKTGSPYGTSPVRAGAVQHALLAAVTEADGNTKPRKFRIPATAEENTTPGWVSLGRKAYSASCHRSAACLHEEDGRPPSGDLVIPCYPSQAV